MNPEPIQQPRECPLEPIALRLADPPRKSWRVNIKVLAWKCVSLPCLGLIYWVVNSQGIRMQMPVFGLRLYRLPIPGINHLQDYEGWRLLDLAHVFAIFLLFAVWYLSVAVLKTLLYRHAEADDPRFNVNVYRRILLTLAGVIIGGDVLIFFCGLRDRVDTLWGDSGLVVPVVATVVYMGVLAFTSLIHVTLEHD